MTLFVLVWFVLPWTPLAALIHEMMRGCSWLLLLVSFVFLLVIVLLLFSPLLLSVFPCSLIESIFCFILFSVCPVVFHIPFFFVLVLAFCFVYFLSGFFISFFISSFCFLCFLCLHSFCLSSFARLPLALLIILSFYFGEFTSSSSLLQFCCLFAFSVSYLRCSLLARARAVCQFVYTVPDSFLFPAL